MTASSNYIVAGTALSGTDSASIQALLTGTGIAAAATGDAATDTTAILAAFQQAGGGGRVTLAANQTYVVGGKGGQLLQLLEMPAIIDLNGSTIQVRPEVTTATTAATLTSGVSTSVPLSAGQGAFFQAGDVVDIAAPTYAAAAYVGGLVVASVVEDTLNFGGTVTLDNGASIAAGGLVQHHDAALFLQPSASTSLTGVTGIVICNGTIDGNADARVANGLRRHWSIHPLVHLINGSFTMRDLRLINAPCEGMLGAGLPFFKATNTHSENTFGSGYHIGGSSAATGDCVVMGNTFKNVTQSTNATAPTCDQYGHIAQSGAICTSAGPFRTTIVGNVVDTATRWGFAAPDVNDQDFTIGDNVFFACGAGAWHVMSGGRGAAIGNNLVKNCGRETAHATGLHEVTVVRGTAGGAQAADTNITGNVFIDSVLLLSNDAADVNVVGNTFSLMNLTNVNGNTNSLVTAAIFLPATSGGARRANITNNKISLPVNATSALNGIKLGATTDVTVSGNHITGGRHGIDVSGVQANLSVTGNKLVDQGASSTGGNPRAINAIMGNASRNFNICDNTISVASTIGMSWRAIDLFANGVTSGSGCVNDNKISVATRPTAGGGGISFNSTAIAWGGFQIDVMNNQIKMANVADAPISPPATGDASIRILLNRMFGGSTPTLTGNTVSIGGGTDSNFYA